MKLAWVIGRGGMLGSELTAALAARGYLLFEPAARLTWDSPGLLSQTMARQAGEFLARSKDCRSWQIYWAAGIGTMGSSASDLLPEEAALRTLAAVLVRGIDGSTGRLCFASSAGAIYAGTESSVVTERSSVAPTSAYAHSKLTQERVVERLAVDCGISCSVARISTIYGSRPPSSKVQGLLTQMARCIIRNQPISIFVPLGTIRDYLSVWDAAARLIDAAESGGKEGATELRIVSSEQPVTIAEIVHIFGRIARRTPRIVTSVAATSNAYGRRIRFRSAVPPLESSRPMTSLPVGISRLMTQERRRFVEASAGSRVTS